MNQEKNFLSILQEIKRQFDIHTKIWDNLDKKAEFVMGITLLFIGYLLTKSEFLVVFRCNSIIIISIFAFGISLILLAGLFSYLSYKGKRFNVGIELDKLMRLYRENCNRNYNQIIGRHVYESVIKNEAITKIKSKLFEWSLISALIGVLLIISSKAAFHYYNYTNKDKHTSIVCPINTKNCNIPATSNNKLLKGVEHGRRK